MIKFKYKPETTIETSALFLQIHNNPMEYSRLLSLLYMADRMTLNEINDSITGDKYFMLNHNPILDTVRTYIILNNSYKHDPKILWYQYISCSCHRFLRLLKDPGIGNLCDVETDIIHKVYKSYNEINHYIITKENYLLYPELKDLTDDKENDDEIPIPIETILHHLNKTKDDIDYIKENIYIDNL